MSTEKKSAIARLTETTLAALQNLIEQGVAPWNKPWCLAKSKGQMSFNSGKPYSPANQLLLEFQMMLRGKRAGEEDEYSTFNQLKKEGVSVKGFKTLAIWRPIVKTYLDETKVDDNGEPLKRTWVGYTQELVFNRQELGLPKRYEETKNEKYTHEMDERIMATVRDYCDKNGIRLTLDPNSNSAFQSEKHIVVPTIGRFQSPEDFYSTLFHELTHSTALCGCTRKCHSEYSNSKDARAQEELVAELGAATLSAYFGLKPVAEPNSAAYLEGWSENLTTDKANAFLKALTMASKAVELFLGDISEVKTEAA